jgi:uncharacterized protein YciI
MSDDRASSTLYVWIGFLKPDAGPIPPAIQVQASDFLGQPLIKIRSAGPLCDAAGKRAAMMMIFEDDSRESAESFVMSSPYLEANLYEEHRLFEYRNEIG